jgi:hypothetical protein
MADQEEPNSEVTNILTELNKRASNTRWQFVLGNQESSEKQDTIVVILTMDKPDKLSIDCKTFMEGITREMTSKNKKSLVNSENTIYIKGVEDRLLPVIGQNMISQSRSDSVSKFVNCSEVKIKESKQECKLPEVIKELIWECIEPKMKDLPMNTAWINELRKFYLPEVELQKLVPEEKEPPICDFFKELRPKSITNTTQDVCGDEMTKYLKEKLADMREDINKVTKRETSAFEKSTELAGNEMWEIINKTIQDPNPSEPQFDPNQFINANINMPPPAEVKIEEPPPEPPQVVQPVVQTENLDNANTVFHFDSINKQVSSESKKGNKRKDKKENDKSIKRFKR